MKLAIALCFSIIVCTVYTFPLDLEKTKLEIKDAISKVERIIQQVDRIHVETEQKTMKTVTERWWNEIDNYNNYVNLLRETMRREVNNAKVFRGVDAEYCYESNAEAINQHTDMAFDMATKCQDSAEKSIQTNLAFLENLVSLGVDLIQELNVIVSKCHDKDDTNMLTCVLNEFGKINADVEEFEESTKYIEYTASTTSNYVVLETTECLANGYFLARYESQGAMMSNSRCVQDAVEKNENSSISFK